MTKKTVKLMMAALFATGMGISTMSQPLRTSSVVSQVGRFLTLMG
jgi:hypothetical protein